MSGFTEGAVGRSYSDLVEEAGADRPPGPAPSPEAAARLGHLIRTLEGEIIPRLMLVHRQTPRVAAQDEGARRDRVTGEDVAELTRLVLAHDAEVSIAYCRTLGARGVSVSAIYLGLLTPVARRLGEMWARDECGFTEVTLGLCRLHQVLRELAPAFRGPGVAWDDARRALLLPAPGEQHMFGVVMVAEFFRRAGWDVRSGPAESADDLVALVRNQWFGLAGLSVSTQRSAGALPRLIERMRRSSRNRQMAIFVGGQLFTEHPELVQQVGADGTGNDARAAALQAENLLAMMG